MPDGPGGADFPHSWQHIRRHKRDIHVDFRRRSYCLRSLSWDHRRGVQQPLSFRAHYDYFHDREQSARQRRNNLCSHLYLCQWNLGVFRLYLHRYDAGSADVTHPRKHVYGDKRNIHVDGRKWGRRLRSLSGHYRSWVKQPLSLRSPYDDFDHSEQHTDQRADNLCTHPYRIKWNLGVLRVDLHRCVAGGADVSYSRQHAHRHRLDLHESDRKLILSRFDSPTSTGQRNTIITPFWPSPVREHRDLPDRS